MLLFQDIAVIPMLAMLPLLAVPVAEAAAHAAGAGTHGAGLSLVDGLNGWQAALVTLGAIAAVIFGGSYLTRPVFRFVSSAGLLNPDPEKRTTLRHVLDIYPLEEDG